MALSKSNDAEKVLKIREFKEKGNALYKEGNIKKAVSSYHRAILYIKGLSCNSPDDVSSVFIANGHGEQTNKMSPEQEKEVKQLTCDCYNNLAACLLKEDLPNFQKISEHCDKALEASPDNVKALFRKATALVGNKSYEAALETLKRAPEDPQFLKLKKECQEMIKKNDKGLSQMYKAMFQL